MSEFDGGYWEGRYASGEPTSRDSPSPALVAEIASLSAGLALDAGCGRGADARWLASRGWQVTAVDVSATAIEQARTSDGRVEWVQADLATWEPGAGRFDLVTSHYVHVPGPPQELFARLASWVAPGGTLLVVGHGHGPEHPAGVLPAGWEVLVDEPRTHRVVQPDGTEGELHDVVVLARRAG